MLKPVRSGPDSGYRRSNPVEMLRYGMPCAGPSDRVSAQIAAALAGREMYPNPVLEVGAFGADIEAEGDVSVGIAGAERQIWVNDRDISAGVVQLRRGDVLRLGPVTRGAVTYVVQAERPRQTRVLADSPWTLPDGEPWIVTQNPAESLSLDPLLKGPWTVDLNSNRTGTRLKGDFAPHDTPDLPSQPQLPGCIQLPRSGQPILLGVEGPTIGGYPLVGLMIQPSRIGQVLPGQEVHFQLLPAQEAFDISREEDLRLSRLTQLLLIGA